MTLPRLSPFVFSALMVGCFTGTPDPDPCAETRRCVAADAVGCCSGGAREVSVCEDSCPAGMIEESECRTAGCGMGCDTPLTCRMDYGSGCCGEAVFTTSCDACPAGSVEATECTSDFPAECGCGSIRGFRLPDAEAPALPASECFEDLGAGCCGAFVGLSECGACPTGTLNQLQCDMMSADRIAPPEVTCREDLGGGCCGAEVSPNACSATCPAGSVETSSCDELLDPAMDRAPAFPAPSCFQLTPEGCCGEAVPLTACGACPEGSSNTCEACEP